MVFQITFLLYFFSGLPFENVGYQCKIQNLTRMKNLLKISLLAVLAGIFAPGCSGCGGRTKNRPGAGGHWPDAPARKPG